MSETIPPDQLFITISGTLSEFAGATAELLDEAAKTAADHAAAELRVTSPRRTGAYQKGWAVKVEKRAKVNGGQTKVIVYNRTDGQLTHLLEDGHAKVVFGRRTGGRVPGIEHIKPTEEKAAEEFISRVRSGIGK